MSTAFKTSLKFFAGAALGFLVLAQLGTWHLPTLASIGWQRVLALLISAALLFFLHRLTDRKGFERGRVTGRIEGRAQAAAELGSRGKRPQVVPTGIDRALTNSLKSQNSEK